MQVSNLTVDTSVSPIPFSPRWAKLPHMVMRYTVTGTVGRPLLLLHEMGGTLESWDPVLPLLPKGQRIIRCDMRGAGGSEKIGAAITCDELADDIAALLDYLNVPQVDVTGVAIGGCMSLTLAIRHPSRVHRLAPINPPTDAEGRAGEVLRERAGLTDQFGMRAVVESALARSYPDILRTDPSSIEAYEAYIARFLTNDPVSYAHILRALIGVDFSGRLEQIRCPTLFIAGKHDFVRLSSRTEQLAPRVPGARFLEIEGGHIPTVQAPQALATALIDFFDL